MRGSRLTFLASVVAVIVMHGRASAQSVTYHLHKEASATAGFFQLRTAAPDGTSLGIQSINLKNQPVGEYVIK